MCPEGDLKLSLGTWTEYETIAVCTETELENLEILEISALFLALSCLETPRYSSENLAAEYSSRELKSEAIEGIR